MKKKYFNNNVIYIFKNSTELAAKLENPKCTTAHIFLSLINSLKTFSEAPEGEVYLNYFNKVKEILNNHGLSGPIYKEAFDAMYPTGNIDSNGEINISCSLDYDNLCHKLKMLAEKEDRTLGVEDLILGLVSDRSYDSYRAMELALQGNSKEADAICKDLYDYFYNAIPRSQSIEELENLPGIKNINKYVSEKKMVFVDVDSYLDKVKMTLSCKISNCPAIVGKAGTGKTTIVYAFADLINRRQAGEFNNKIIYRLDLSDVVSGSRFRGEFEEKLLNILKIASKNKDKVILFVDEMHMMCGAGDSSDGTMDASNIMKQYISDGEIQMIGATTNEEFAKYIEKDKAFARRFNKVLVSEPTKEETIKILNGVKEDFDNFYKKKASEELIREVVLLSSKYSIDQANPARALTMLDIAYAHSKIFNEKSEIVMSDDIREAIKIKYDIIAPENRTEATTKALEKSILGQKEILEKIEGNLRYIEKGLVDTTKPLASLIFGGPTGVGKTETCKIIAKNFFGSENSLIKINMG